jgi:hypothetical protein
VAAAPSGSRGGVVGSPRPSRIRTTPGREVTAATTAMRPEQRTQARTSCKKTLQISEAQGNLPGFRGASAPRGAGWHPAGGVLWSAADGTISRLAANAGAKTPWYLARCARGRGTSPIRRSTSSWGENRNAVVPSRHGRLSRSSSLPSSSSVRRSVAIGGRARYLAMRSTPKQAHLAAPRNHRSPAKQGVPSAVGENRTPTVLLPPEPESGASTSSATTAAGRGT